MWYSGIKDPIYTLNTFKFSDEELNFSNWEQPEFQKLLNLSDQAINPFQRSSYLLQAEEILKQEVPVIPLFYQPHQALITKNLLNVRVSFSGFSLTKSFLKKEI